MRKIGNFKEFNGITLIALVVTIVILIILASVAITMSLNNGIISKAKFAGDEYIKTRRVRERKH